jgi:lipopolysaccharide transport system permease protein
MTEPMVADSVAAQRTVLAPTRWFHGAADPWRHRKLVLLLARFELRRRYRYPMTRVALVLAPPLILTAVATAVFGHTGTIDGLPYAVYVLSGLIPWQLVQSALVGADAVLSSDQRFIPRVHFPSIVVPFAAVCASLVELLPTVVVLLGLLAYRRVPLAGAVAAVPLWMLIPTLTALAVALWLLPLRVRHRSVRNAIPFLSLVWLLGSPVFWAGTMLAPSQPMLGINPMVSAVLGFRSALLGTMGPPVLTVVASLASIGVALIGGWAYFRDSRLAICWSSASSVQVRGDDGSGPRGGCEQVLSAPGISRPRRFDRGDAHRLL